MWIAVWIAMWIIVLATAVEIAATVAEIAVPRAAEIAISRGRLSAPPPTSPTHQRLGAHGSAS